MINGIRFRKPIKSLDFKTIQYYFLTESHDIYYVVPVVGPRGTCIYGKLDEERFNSIGSYTQTMYRKTSLSLSLYDISTDRQRDGVLGLRYFSTCLKNIKNNRIYSNRSLRSVIIYHYTNIFYSS